MNRFKLFDTDEKSRFHIGLRIIKTVVAVFCCAMLGYVRREESAIFSMIAAIMCMQPTRDESFLNAWNRTMGTLVGGVMGAACLYFSRLSGAIQTPTLYYFIVSILLIPLIEITLLIKKPSIASFSCVVFLSVTVTRMSDSSPIEYAALRMVDTLIGIIIGLGVNLILPSKKTKQEVPAENEADDQPPKSDD